MWARTRFDIGWSDLAAGALACAAPGDRDALQRDLEAQWSDGRDALACYSVRSGFDLLLRELDLPRGSEVLFSAITIRGMLKVVRRQGLVAVPADLDVEHAAPRLDALERAVSERTRVLVVAHLFGSRIDLEPVLAFARRRGLFVVEDCAQAYDGPGDTGHPEVDAAFFSFGPLKTSTALGGALARVRDPALLARMRARQARYPVQKRSAYAARLLRFAGLKALAYRLPYAVIVRTAGLAGRPLDASLTETVRGIAKQKSAKSLQQRASHPMLRLLRRRLRGFRPTARDARVRSARALIEGVCGLAASPGAANERHAFWACTLLAKDPPAVVSRLRRRGFDAAASESLCAVPAPDDRPALEPVCARQILSELVFLPCYPTMGPRHVSRQVRALREAFGA